MPRNIYQQTCQHTLYASGCTLAKSVFGGVDAGVTAAVNAVAAGSALTLGYVAGKGRVFTDTAGDIGTGVIAILPRFGRGKLTFRAFGDGW